MSICLLLSYKQGVKQMKLISIGTFAREIGLSLTT